MANKYESGSSRGKTQRLVHPAAGHFLRYEFIVSFLGKLGVAEFSVFRCFGVLCTITCREFVEVNDLRMRYFLCVLCDESLTNYIFIFNF